MRRNRIMKRTARLAMVAAVMCTGSSAFAQLSYLRALVPANVAVPQNQAGTSTLALAAFGYSPVGDRMFTASFSDANQQLRVIENLSGTPTFTTLVNNSEWTLFNRGGLPNASGGAPTPGGIVLNPKPIGAIPAFSLAVITDGGAVVTLGSPAVQQPTLTQRLYQYNLPVSLGGSGTPTFQSLATISNMAAAITPAPTNNTTNVARQPAFSTDGQSVYFIDTSTAYGGLWQKQLATGQLTRLVATSDEINTEPAVVRVNGLDRVVIRGGGATGNVGGLDYFDTDGTPSGTSARQVLVSAAQLADFWGTTTTATIFSAGADDQGNIYFGNTNTATQRRGIFRLDTEGRLSKVISYRERQLAFGGTPNANTLRIQFRTTSDVPDGYTLPTIRQLLYAESSPLNLVAAVSLFQPGDFNHDGVAGAPADLALFSAALTPRGVAAADTSLRLDLNGDDVVDWKDVKVLQQFVPIPTGDTNFDLAADLSDLTTIGLNYQRTGNATWRDGDLSGDNTVNLLDLELFAGGITVAPPTLSFLLNPDFSDVFRNDVRTVFSINPLQLGDFNFDGGLDGSDVDPFVLALSDLTTYLTDYQDAFDALGTGLAFDQSVVDLIGDFNGDGGFDGSDVDGFVAALSGARPGVAMIPEPSILGLIAPLMLLSSRRRRPSQVSA